jgi:hypothetical protein
MFKCLVILVSLATNTLCSRPGSLYLLSADHVYGVVGHACGVSAGFSNIPGMCPCHNVSLVAGLNTWTSGSLGSK